jgi:hypothetical protein
MRQPLIKWGAPKRQATAMTLHFRIQILGVKPPIWRTVTVPARLSLAGLHRVIQDCFDWRSSGEHYFTLGELQYTGDTQPDKDEIPAEHAHATPYGNIVLTQFDFRAGDRFLYQYELRLASDPDWESRWTLAITVEATEESPKPARPRCTDGARAAPPDNAGDSDFYEMIVAWWDDPFERDSIGEMSWMPEDFDPERFDLARIDEAVSRVRK